MAIHNLIIRPAFEWRDRESLQSIAIGDANVNVQEVRILFNTWLDFDASKDHVNGLLEHSSYSLTLTPGQRHSGLRINKGTNYWDVFYNASVIVIGDDDSALDLTQRTANLGKPIAAVNELNVRRTMLNLRWKLSEQIRRLTHIELTA